MNNIKTIILLIIIFVIAVAGIYYLYQTQVVNKNLDLLPYPSPTTTFEDLVSPSPISSPVGKLTPPRVQPEAGSNTIDVKNIGIEVESPQASSVISSTVYVKGRANVFEGKVQINVKDTNGKILGSNQATACMGYDACPFETVINFDQSTTEAGILEVYNPSGIDGSPKYLQQILIRF